MFHDIVVPLDGSSLAECAIGPAGRIVTECGARLHLVRVHVRHEGSSSAEDAVARAGVARYLHEMAGWLREGSTHETLSEVLDGSPALAIADYADRVNADLIVMTTHGRTGVERRKLGSVAAVVAHHVSCPVVLARGESGEYVPRQAPLKHIVLGVDGSERPEDVEAFALRFGSLGHPSFRIVHTLSRAGVPQLAHANAVGESGGGDERQATDKAESYVGGIAGRLRAAGLRAEILVSVMDDPPRALLDAAERDGADAIIVMGQRH